MVIMRPLTGKKRLFKKFLCVFVPILGIVLLISWGIYYLQHVKLRQDILKAQESYSLNLKREFVKIQLNGIIADVRYIAGHKKLLALLNTHLSEPQITEDLLLFSRFKGIYDQIRVLENSGQEIVRIDLQGNKPVLLQKSALQFKGQRYYFQDIHNLQEGQIYMSHFDLNVEHGEVEFPLKPMIRFGTPLFDTEGVKQGVLVVNYLGNQLLTELGSLSFNSPDNITLLNSDGYWLKGNIPEQEWGFMFPSRADQKMQNRSPELWQKILTHDSGQYLTNDGLLTFIKISPAQNGGVPVASNAGQFPIGTHSLVSKDPFWVIVSRVPKNKLHDGDDGFVFAIFWLDFLLLVFIGVIGWQMIIASEKRRSAEKELRLLNFELEEKVQNRTKALSDSNAALEKKIEEHNQVVNEKQKMELQLQQAQKMEAIGTLAGGIAHDFNNILTPILGYAEIAAMDLGEDHHLQPDLREIISSANRAKDLILQILTFSRETSLECVPLKVQLLIKETLKLLTHSIPSTIQIKTRIDSNCSAVKANPTQIHQIIMNLCTNAYHAMIDTGGILSISLTEIEIGSEDYKTQISLKPGIYLKLEVCDTGCGMNSELQKKIFDPYFTTKEKGKGTGLGLSIVHGIVQSLHGQITVYSEPEQGACFRLYLPTIQSKIEPHEFSDTQEAPRGTERILIVDDEELIAKIEKRILEKLGYTVTLTSNPEELLDIVRKRPNDFDLVISDLTMPNMTGLSLADEIKKSAPHLPIIIATGYSEAVNAGKFLDLGIWGCINKPVTVREIAHAVRHALESKQPVGI